MILDAEKQVISKGKFKQSFKGFAMLYKTIYYTLLYLGSIKYQRL